MAKGSSPGTPREIGQDSDVLSDHSVLSFKRGNARAGINREVLWGVLLPLGKSRELRLVGHAGLLDGDVRGEGAGARREIKREHGKPSKIASIGRLASFGSIRPGHSAYEKRWSEMVLHLKVQLETHPDCASRRVSSMMEAA